MERLVKQILISFSKLLIRLTVAILSERLFHLVVLIMVLMMMGIGIKTFMIRMEMGNRILEKQMLMKAMKGK